MMGRLWRVALVAVLASGSLATKTAWACTEGKVAFAFEQITVAAAAIGFTTATWNTVPPATCAEVRVETAQIRYRTDNTDPTATVGMILEAGDVLYLQNLPELTTLSRTKFIRTGSTSATIDVTYWR